MNLRVLLAIFKRNFFSYFANPTGYVFICGFVLVSGFAAFWPHEFFNANLANLDQLNKYLPFIMLGFVPAITMSMWAEERRLGTDELLLTLPASDLDVVLGKYLAAVAIFTVSLLFSAAANIFVLFRLGNPDTGLLATTIAGYWFVGVAMLAVGMVASFLTSNLTVGFVLGVALNAPLVFAQTNDVIISNPALSQSIRQWSVSTLFADFARGVVSLSSVVYFLSIVAIGLYLSMVLIGRRHWVTGRSAQGAASGGSMLGHFICRAVAVIIIAIGLSLIFRVHDVRVDASSEKLSSLSPKSVELLNELGDRRVTIEAFVSPEDKLPESYIQTRINLLNTLSEIEKRSNGKVSVVVHETETYKPEKTIAEQRFGIKSRPVEIRDRGQVKRSDVFMGVAMTSGLDKRVIEFVDRGVPTEYEVVSRIASLALDRKKKTLGVVKTDAPMMGQMSMMMMGQPPENERFIKELERLYEVVEVNANQPIEKRYDALLVVQPSTLEQPQIDNLVAAIKAGMPTAIFEDPAPIFPFNRAGPPPGTLEPRRPQQMDPMMMRMGMQPQMPGPKGRLADLWDLLGCEIPVRKHKTTGSDGNEKTVDAIDLITQNYNPYPSSSDIITNEYVFVGKSGGPLADDPTTRGLQYILFPFTGSIAKKADSKLLFTPLATTSAKINAVASTDLYVESERGPIPNPDRKAVALDQPRVLAARIEGKTAPESAKINVILVADIDLISSFFFGYRDMGADERLPFYIDVDNVTFGLNIIDNLADESTYFDIRSRRRVHRALTAFEKSTEDARKKKEDEKEAAQDQLDKKLDEIRAEHRQRIGDLVKERIAGEIDDRQLTIKKDAAEAQLSRVLMVEQQRLSNLAKERIEEAEADLELAVRRIQNNEKRLAVFIPPIFPLIIALLVFTWRRTRELEGAVKSRLR